VASAVRTADVEPKRRGFALVSGYADLLCNQISKFWELLVGQTRFWSCTYTVSPAAAAAAAGGLLSGALFQYPGAIIMTAVGVFAAGNLVDPKGALAGVASGGQFIPGYLHVASGFLSQVSHARDRWPTCQWP
jgi:hypothetical protein